ncbi:Uncharacterised protein [Bordetella pertussis]|nr:Uncharacterised protein [Bordetella pertussis]
MCSSMTARRYRVTELCSSTRSSLTCWYEGRSPISSRNSVPPLACSK